MKRILFIIGIILIIIPILSSAGIVSTDYSVELYGMELSAGNTSNSDYNADFSLTYKGINYAENSDYDVYIGWFYPSGAPAPAAYCGDGTCDAGETCSSCPADCGVCSITPPGGGGGVTCNYDWVCSDWYPQPCPAEEIQNRACVNRGTCTGIVGIPNDTRECTYVPSEPLFDIFARIPLIKKFIAPGESIDVNIKLMNLGDITPIDVYFKYWITDENNALITEFQETRAISEKGDFMISMDFPKEIKLGKYKFYVEINYDIDKTAIAQDSFEVVQSKIGKFIFMILLWIIIFLILFVVIFLIFRLTKFRIPKSYS